MRLKNLIGHMLHRNFLKHVIEGRMEGKRRRVTRHLQLLDDLKEKRRCWNLKEEALPGTPGRTRFGKGYGPVVRRSTEWMNEWMNVCPTSSYWSPDIYIYSADFGDSVFFFFFFHSATLKIYFGHEGGGDKMTFPATVRTLISVTGNYVL